MLGNPGMRKITKNKLWVLPLFLIYQGCLSSRSSNSEISDAEALAIRSKMVDDFQSDLETLEKELSDSQYTSALSNHQKNAGSVLALQGSRDTAPSLQTANKQIRELWLASGKNVCKLLQPILDSSMHDVTHPYFFVGQNVAAGVGLQGVRGRDYVWDLYNLQFSIFDYIGAGLVLGGGSVTAGVSTYLGSAIGTVENIDDAWSGKFVSATVSGSLPLLSTIGSIGLSGFTSTDANFKPNYTIRGASAAVNLSLPDPTGLPIGTGIQQAEWKINTDENQKIFNVMTKKWKLKASLSGSATCNDRCIRFDSESIPANYRSRAISLIKSIPVVALNKKDATMIPMFPEIALTAMAIGTIRDQKNGQAACQRTPTFRKIGS